MKSLRTKLLLTHVSLAFVTAIVTPFAMSRFMESQLLDNLERQLTANAAALSRAVGFVWDRERTLDERSKQALRQVRLTAKVIGGRIRLLDAKGNTLVDSMQLRSAIPVAERREVRSALRGRFDSALCGYGNEKSDLCIALPVKDSGGTVGVAYVGAPVEQALHAMPDVRLRLGVASLFGFTVAFPLSMIMSLAIARPVIALTSAARRLSAGDFGVRAAPAGRDEIGTLTENFNRMAERLHGVDEERRTFLADVAHELRTPLTAIRGSAETLQSFPTPDPQASRFAGNIVQQADRLRRLVDDLLQLARLESGTLKMQRMPVDLCEIGKQVCDELRPIADRHRLQIELQAEQSDESFQVIGDPVYLAQVFVNVIGNAIRHASEGTAITVRISRDKADIEAEVSDHGTGIPPEDLPHIFERFYRADSSRGRDDSTQGSGLGLSIARRIVEAHNGTIIAYAKVGEGTRIVLTVPTQSEPRA